MEEQEKQRLKDMFNDTFKYEIMSLRDGELKRELDDLVEFSVEKPWFEMFLTEPASSTGKYHPPKECEPFGLVYHSKAVFWIAIDYLRSRSDLVGSESPYTRDEVLIACLLHDFLKYQNERINESTGKPHTSPKHPWLTSKYIDFWIGKTQPKRMESWARISSLILTHHGQWSFSKDDNVVFEWEKPTDEIHWLVHYSDYIASRNFISLDMEKIYDSIRENLAKE